MNKTIGLVSVSVLSLCLAQGVMAQNAPQGADSGGGIQDIIVTATRQSTNLQDTPIAITAATSEMLEERGLKSVADLTAVVPNTQFRRAQSAFGPGVTTVIRGIISSDTSLGGEASVAYYIDDVYYPILLGSNFDLLDIDHVEVLRGPQGTLFGRNSLAGAVNIVGKQPDLNDASGYVEVTTGRYNRFDVRAGFNMPISDTLAVMFSGVSKKREGFMRRVDFTCEMNRRGTPALAGNFPIADPLNQTTPNYTANDCTIGHLGGEDVRAVKGVALWQPMDNLRITITGDYTKDQSDNPPDQVVDIDPARQSNNVKTEAAYWGLAVDNRFVSGSRYISYATYADQIRAGTVIAGNSYYNGMLTRGGYKLSPQLDLDSWGVSGKVVWGLTGQIDLTAVVGYRDMNETHAFDTDGLPLVVEHTWANIANSYFHAEARLSGKMDWIDWVAGAFYFDADGYNHAITIGVSAGQQKTQFTTYEPTSKAVYANATVRPFGDQLGIVLGARYSDDRKPVNYSNLTDIYPKPNAGDLEFFVEPSQKKFDWKLGLNYELNDNMLVYASAATGNSLPGFNPRPLQPTQAASFDGNDSIAYEIGAKLDLFDRRLRLNGAAFYTNFKNRPTGLAGSEPLIDTNPASPTYGKPLVGNQQLEQLPGAPAGVLRCATATVPAGTGITCIGRTYYVNQPAKIRGFELEMQANPIDGLTLNGAVGYSKFTSPDIERRAVNTRQFNPFWTANLGIQYEWQVDALGGSVTPRLDWAYESSRVISATSTKYNGLNGAYAVVNGRLTYRNDDHDFSVAAGVTNLFNTYYYYNMFDYQGLNYPQTDAQPAPPRQWYLTVSKRF